jgi:hypothetical protein
MEDARLPIPQKNQKGQGVQGKKKIYIPISLPFSSVPSTLPNSDDILPSFLTSSRGFTRLSSTATGCAS